MAYRIEQNIEIHLEDGFTLPPFTVYDEDNAPVYYGVTEQQCQDWIDNNGN